MSGIQMKSVNSLKLQIIFEKVQGRCCNGKTYEVSELGDMLIYQNEKGDTKVDVYFLRKTSGWVRRPLPKCITHTTEYNHAYQEHL